MRSSFTKASILLLSVILNCRQASADNFVASEIAAAPGDRDRGVGVIATGANLFMFTINQAGAFGTWSNWASLRNQGYVRVVMNSPGSRMHDYFVIGGSDLSIYHRKGNTGNFVFDGLGLPGAKGLSVAQIPGGGFELFALGPDNTVWHKWQSAPDANWTDWESLGGWGSRIAAVVIPGGGLELYVVGQDNAVWHKWQGAPFGSWSDWESLGGTASEIAVSPIPDRSGGLEVFIIGSDRAVWHRWQANSYGEWSDWESLGGILSGGLTVEKGAAGGIGVFAMSPDGTVFSRQQGSPRGDWANWRPVLGITAKRFAVVPIGEHGGAEVFAIRADDGVVVHAWRDTTIAGWAAWTPLIYEQPAPPPPPAPVIVPGVIGELESTATDQLVRTGLQLGTVINPTGEIQTKLLRVVFQYPSMGSKVERNSSVNLRVELANNKPAGVKSLQVFNCSQRGQPISFWTSRNGAQWSKAGNLSAPSGECGQGQSLGVSLDNGVAYSVAAVDTSLLNCGQDNPGNVNCQYQIYAGIIGYDQGEAIPLFIQ